MRLPLVILAIALLALVFASCSSDDPITPAGQALKEFILSIDTYPDPSAENDGTHRELGSENTEETTAEGRFICVETDYRMDKNLDEVVVFDVNALGLWPGAIVQGQDLDNGLLTLITQPRAPLRVGTNLPGLGPGENERTVDSPDHLSVQAAINEIVDGYLAQETSIPARLSFHETFAESYEQAMLDLSIATSWSAWVSGSVQTDIAASSEEYSTSYFCQFTQSYFTATTVPPASPEDMFSDGVRPEDCEAYMADGNPPCWVSSVTYGRIGILAVYSHYSRSDLQVAVQAAFSTMGWDLDSELDTYNQQILNESEFKLLILGGNATDGVQAIFGDPMVGLQQWIENGAELSDSSLGLPIAYTANYLKDNRLASFAYSCEWTHEECLPVARRFYVDINRLHAYATDDGFADNELEVYYTFNLWRDLPTLEAPEVLMTWTCGSCGYYNMPSGDNEYPDAELYFDMPDLVDAGFQLQFILNESDGSCDSPTYDDAIGNYSTTWYDYPLWRESSGDCEYPVDWGTAGGEAATCGQRLANDGMDVGVYWDVSIVEEAR